MATMQKQNEKDQMQTQKREGQEGGIGSPISNDAYNILSALHAKLEGLEAYRKYSKDGDSEVWREMSDSDVKCVERLCDELERMVKEGRFRQMNRPGQSGMKA
jgi:hypothetical protein